MNLWLLYICWNVMSLFLKGIDGLDIHIYVNVGNYNMIQSVKLIHAYICPWDNMVMYGTWSDTWSKWTEMYEMNQSIDIVLYVILCIAFDLIKKTGNCLS